MEVENYNTAIAKGIISHVFPEFKKGDHRIVSFVIDCENVPGVISARPKQLHVKAWDALGDKVLVMQPGDAIKVMVSISSKPNKFNPELWFHCVTLKKIL